MDDLYRENILDHFRNPRNYGRINNPDVSWEENNVVCGDRIGIDLQLTINNQQSTIKDIRFFGEGCAISMASASLLTETVKGLTIDQAKNITPNEIKKMLGIEPTPTRLKCALLPLETIQKALILVKDR